MSQRIFIIDFDSTLIRVEAFDLLAEIALEGCGDREERLAEIRATTAACMNGTVAFGEGLRRRVALLRIRRAHLDRLSERLKRAITPSFLEQREFLTSNADSIYVVTGSFREYVLPVVELLGLRPDHVFANTFIFDKEGNVTGIDEANPLAHTHGKMEAIRALSLEGNIFVIGDGYTDYEIKTAIPTAHFIAFTENVAREAVVSRADKVVDNFNEVIYHSDGPVRLSYPKSRIRALLLENVHPRAAEVLSAEGYQVEMLPDALDEEALASRLRNVSILGIRSKTCVSKAALQASKKLMAVGAFCIGTDQIDLASCADHGVIAFNAPYSNTRSVVELAIGEIIMLIRRVFEASRNLHEGKWLKRADGAYEVRGKKLGIIGYGNIGSQLSVLAESLGMNVYYYDILEKLSLGNARKCRSMEELLMISDIVTLHIDGRPSNNGLIGEREFALMKEGVILLNLSRGSVVDTDALVNAVRSGKVAGAGVDVYEHEPQSNKDEFVSPLRSLPNVIITPHIGGSTLEAQQNIAEYVAERIISYINTGNSMGSVNFPEIQLSDLLGSHRLLHVHFNVPGILAQINSTLALFKINILGQYLKTTERIGYVITDVNRQYSGDLIDELKSIPDTIKFRVLY